MKKQDLHSLVQECIAEVLAEKQTTTEGYDEFQRVDKGSKGVAAKDKAEEDTYGAGYAAGEKAAKAKYKKLAEAFMLLKKGTDKPKGITRPTYGDESEEETARMYASVNQPTYGDESEEEVARMMANLDKLRRGEEVDETLKEEGFGLDKNTPKDSNDKNIDEARFKKGEDIGKPGAGFKKVAKAAEKQYGSKEAGQKVAGAILKKVLKK